MINLSKRLKTVAKFVLDNNTRKIIDVGCDHALLDIYLLQNNSNLKIIASDNKKAPLENARKNIEKYSFLNKIELSLRDGIDNIDNLIDTIVISGMGMETIVEILEKNKDRLTNIKRLIISSNNKYFDLRKKIINLGFKINREEIVFEDNKYYIVIEFVKENISYKEKELYFGPLLLQNKDQLFNDYYLKIIQEKESIINKLDDNNSKKKELEKEIKLLNEEIK